MAEPTASLARKPCYVVMSFMQHRESSWAVCDKRTGRVAVEKLGIGVAYTLAHTLNVADLAVSAHDYSRDL